MGRREISTVTPEFFYEELSKKTKVPVKDIRELYHHYLCRVAECLKTEKKIMVRGLGTFELSPEHIFYNLHKFARYLDVNPTSFIDEIKEAHNVWYQSTSSAYKDLLAMYNIFENRKTDKKKYEYIKRNIEKLRGNYRRFEEFFDNEGNCRRSFKIKNGNMQPVSL